MPLAAVLETLGFAASGVGVVPPEPPPPVEVPGIIDGVATSDVGIVNLALAEIGEGYINSLQDQSRQARIMERLYPEILDQVLRAHTWNCASKRATLEASGTVPDWGYEKQYLLPPDFLRLVRTEEPRAPSRVEGRYLLANLGGQARIVYVFRLRDVTVMDELLVGCVATRLAFAAQMAIKGTDSGRRDLWALYNDKLTEARLVDSQEGPPEAITGETWTHARLGHDEPFRPIAES